MSAVVVVNVQYLKLHGLCFVFPQLVVVCTMDITMRMVRDLTRKPVATGEYIQLGIL